MADGGDARVTNRWNRAKFRRRFRNLAGN